MVSDLLLQEPLKGDGLNPCFNGRWSRTAKFEQSMSLIRVLILVLMEDGLGPTNILTINSFIKVLILVLMEDGLGRLLNDTQNLPVYQS